jgi:hypothetical protein
MEGKLIRKYREIFSRIPKNNNTIKDILVLMGGKIDIVNENSIEFLYSNMLEKTNHVDWLRSRGVRHSNIVINDNKICSDVSFCCHLQCVIEFVLFLHKNNINTDFFHKSIYSTENSRDI